MFKNFLCKKNDTQISDFSLEKKPQVLETKRF